jgi:cytochrome bd-type quinol oxidase subunit 2
MLVRYDVGSERYTGLLGAFYFQVLLMLFGLIFRGIAASAGR